MIIDSVEEANRLGKTQDVERWVKIPMIELFYIIKIGLR